MPLENRNMQRFSALHTSRVLQRNRAWNAEQKAETLMIIYFGPPSRKRIQKLYLETMCL